jgi:NADPH:quinone reductase-like Zn-dependent oxidoreductase
MKAIVRSEYGSPDVLRLADVPKPATKANEVLVRVRSISFAWPRAHLEATR